MMDLKQARERQRTLEITVMKMIRAFEEETGCVITKAEMMAFEDTKFFTMTVWLGRECKKRGEEQ
ncbi:hypothetical protein LCGC14_2101690 [marine sediment metagenome]|uniref:Uncharacterized protein n=1 Tax=marine sediment metagenome TaxID=412755 RepID=A0A0F9H699_9ZZZZ